MSLLRLLTAGKSLVGLKKGESRYHLPGNRSLPRFGSKKNPFRATVFPDKTEPAPEAAAQACQAPVKVAEVAKPVEVETPPEESRQKQKSPKSPAACDASDDSRVAAQPPRRSGLKVLLLWGRAKKPKASGLFSGRPLVQGELSLDTVKVVRNDLSESDLEVVQANPVATSKPNKNHRSGSGPKVPGSAEEYYAAAGELAAGKT